MGWENMPFDAKFRRCIVAIDVVDFRKLISTWVRVSVDPFWSQGWTESFLDMGKGAKNVNFRLSSPNDTQCHGDPSTKLDTSKPSAAPTAMGGREYTVSIALPGSIIANSQRLDGKTNLAGQV